jgi:hypothetical protein
MSTEEIIEVLRARASRLTATELVRLLALLIDVPISDGPFTIAFARAFPEIPLRTLRQAAGWRGMDAVPPDLDQQLAEWLPRKK